MVKIVARISVAISPNVAPHRFPATSEWCAKVTAHPEAKRSKVLKRGRAVASRGMIPVGGQVTASSKDGESAL